jgi:hypothetical protein
MVIASVVGVRQICEADNNENFELWELQVGREWDHRAHADLACAFSTAKMLKFTK